GVVTYEQVAAALEEQAKSPERLLGSLLVERGLIDEPTLERYLRLQTEEAIFHLFTWSRGTFRFAPGQQPDAAEPRVAIAAESLLLEAARRVDEWSLIEQQIPSLDLVFRADHDRIAGLDVELTGTQ